ncbi:midasin isoform X1, partial [Tachysurus ichikawai]
MGEDLLKWCERICVNFDSSSSNTAQNVFLEALDCFTAMQSKAESRRKLAEIIGSKLNISKEKVRRKREEFPSPVVGYLGGKKGDFIFHIN